MPKTLDMIRLEHMEDFGADAGPTTPETNREENSARAQLHRALQAVEGLYSTDFATDPLNKERLDHALSAAFSGIRAVENHPELKGKIAVELPTGRIQREGIPVEELMWLLKEAADASKTPVEKKQEYLNLYFALESKSRSYFDIHFPKADKTLHDPEHPQLVDRKGKDLSDQQHPRTQLEAYFLSLPENHAYREWLAKQYPQFAEYNDENNYRLAMEVMRTRRELIYVENAETAKKIEAKEEAEKNEKTNTRGKPKDESKSTGLASTPTAETSAPTETTSEKINIEELETLRSEIEKEFGIQKLKVFIGIKNSSKAKVEEAFQKLTEFLRFMQPTRDECEKVREWRFDINYRGKIKWPKDDFIRVMIRLSQIEDMGNFENVAKDIRQRINSREPRREAKTMPSEKLVAELRDQYGVDIIWKGESEVQGRRVQALTIIRDAARKVLGAASPDREHVPVILHGDHEITDKMKQEDRKQGIGLSLRFLAFVKDIPRAQENIERRMQKWVLVKSLRRDYPSINFDPLEHHELETLMTLQNILQSLEEQGVDIGKFEIIKLTNVGQMDQRDIENRALILARERKPEDNIAQIAKVYRAAYGGEKTGRDSDNEVEASMDHTEPEPKTSEQIELENAISRLGEINDIARDVYEASKNTKLDAEYDEFYPLVEEWMMGEGSAGHDYQFNPSESQSSTELETVDNMLKIKINGKKLEYFSKWYSVEGQYFGYPIPVAVDYLVESQDLTTLEEVHQFKNKLYDLVEEFGTSDQLSEAEACMK